MCGAFPRVLDLVRLYDRSGVHVWRDEGAGGEDGEEEGGGREEGWKVGRRWEAGEDEGGWRERSWRRWGKIEGKEKTEEGERGGEERKVKEDGENGGKGEERERIKERREGS